ncbi:MAG: InlB B-repeat-containing protein [Prevotellaceae bacterium]|jgi:uncharacterized repeat protein (TIGR02543 family)|nr:InlB B-repeat-containing protein [Prevotellaceae bacterium]
MKRNFLSPIRYLLLAGVAALAGTSVKAYDYTGYDYVEDFNSPLKKGSLVNVRNVGTINVPIPSTGNGAWFSYEAASTEATADTLLRFVTRSQGGHRVAAFELDTAINYDNYAVVEFDWAVKVVEGNNNNEGLIAVRDTNGKEIFTLSHKRSPGRINVAADTLSMEIVSDDPFAVTDNKFLKVLNEADDPTLSSTLRWFHIKAAIYVGYGIVFEITNVGGSAYSKAFMLPLRDGFTPAGIDQFIVRGLRNGGNEGWETKIDNIGIKGGSGYVSLIDSLNAPTALVGKTFSANNSQVPFTIERKDPLNDVDSVLRLSVVAQGGNRRALYALDNPVHFAKKASIEFDWLAGSFGGGNSGDEAQITFRSGVPSISPLNKEDDIFTIYCKRQATSGIYFAVGGIPIGVVADKPHAPDYNTRKVESTSSIAIAYDEDENPINATAGIPAAYRAAFSDAPLGDLGATGNNWYHVKVDLYVGERAAITISSHDTIPALNAKYFKQAIVAAPEGWNHTEVSNMFISLTRAGNINWQAAFDNFSVRIADNDYVEPESISISPQHTETGLSGTNKLTAMVTPFDVTNPATVWSLRNAVDSAAATIVADPANSQVATLTGGVTPGTVGVIATTVNGISDTLLMNIKEVLVDSIAISGDTLVTINNTITLSKATWPANAGKDSVTWSSSNDNIAVVDPVTGVVTGKDEGVAIITATAKDGSNEIATHSVTVKYLYVARIDMHGARRVFYTANPASEPSFAVTPVISPSTASVKTLTWSTTDANIVEANSDGTVVTLKGGYGKAAVTATTNDGSGVVGYYYVEVAQESPYALFTDFENGVLAPFRTPTSTGGTSMPAAAFQQTRAIQVDGSGSGNRFGIIALENAIEGHVINLRFDWYANINDASHRGVFSIRSDSSSATGIKHDAAVGANTIDNNLLTISYRMTDATPYFGYYMGNYINDVAEWPEGTQLSKLNKLDTWYTLDVTIDFYRSKVVFSIKERDNPEATETVVEEDLPRETITIVNRVKSLLPYGYRVTSSMTMKQAIDNFAYNATTYALIPVTFEPDGGTFDDESTTSKVINVISGETFANLIPNDLTRANHDFLGWSLPNGTLITDSYTTTEAVTLTAKYQVHTYTVTFAGEGISGIPTQTVDHGGKVTEPAEPSRSGYLFDGWYNGSTYWDFGSATVTADLTLTAHWEEDEEGTTPPPTGVDGSVLSGVSLYPNPAGSYVTLSGLEGGEAIDFIGVSGTLLLSRRAAGSKETIDIASLPQGSYVVRVTKGRAAAQLKLVVVK